MVDQNNNNAEGQHTFLHFPTTTTVPIDVSTLFDVNMGDETEILYMFEEMRRRQTAIVLMTGENVVCLPRIRQGTRCAFWKSEEEQCEKPLDPRSICYNTGWVGGYHNPLMAKIVYPPANRTAVFYEAGVRKEYTPKPWTIHEPKLQVRDVIVQQYSGTRSEITAVNYVTFRGLVLHQELTLRELTRGTETFIYAVPVPMQ